MQSINQSVAGKKMGHTRRQSYGKIMPISDLLNNCIGPTTSNIGSEISTVSDPVPLTHSLQALTMNNRVNERSDSDQQSNVTNLPLNFLHTEKLDEQSQTELNQTESTVAAIDVDKTFLKCTNYHHRDSIVEIDEEPVIRNAKVDPEDDIDRVLIDDTPCAICTNKSMIQHNLMNILCKKLCNDSCNTSTKTCQSNDDILTEKSERSSNGKDVIDENEKHETTNVLRKSKNSRQEFLASMLEADQNDERIKSNHQIDGDETNIAPLTVENLKQFNKNYFREKLAIAEALANTSMMTSPAAKRRLAARKIEMSLNTPDFVYDPENAEYIPPKELLMYLVR